MEIKYLVPKDAIRQPLTAPPQPPDFSSLKEPAEAFKVLSLEAMTGEILQRRDLSQWQKADLLSQNLERYLSLKQNLQPNQPVPQEPSAVAAPIIQVRQVPKRNRTRTLAAKIYKKRRVTAAPLPIAEIPGSDVEEVEKVTAPRRTYGLRTNRAPPGRFKESPIKKTGSRRDQRGTGWITI
jgi:hypothetical protein